MTQSPNTYEMHTPVLVCRWRLVDGKLPLANRHLRALRSREIAGKPMLKPLVAWVKEHIDWTLERDVHYGRDGVLTILIDERFHATMATGLYEPLASITSQSLVERAITAQQEAETTRVAPETLWLVCEDHLEWYDNTINVASGTSTLMCDLAHTLGLGVQRYELPANPATLFKEVDNSMLFVSDEHGIIVPSDRQSLQAQRFAEAYDKLLASLMRRKSRHAVAK